MTVPVILKPLSDRVIAALFTQACVGTHKAEPYLDVLRRLLRLVELELQAQIFNAAHERDYGADRRSRKRALEAIQRASTTTEGIT